MKKTLFAMALAAIAAMSTSATETFEYGYCGQDINQMWGGVDVMGAAIEVPAEQASQLAGYKVVGIQIGAGDGNCKVIPFVAHRFGADSDKKLLVKKPVDLNLSQWNEVAFNTPYTITDETFYIGYYVSGIVKKARPIGSDGSDAPSPYNWEGHGSTLTGMWDSFKQTGEYGNFCIRLIIEGDKLPVDKVSLRGINVPVVVKPGEPFEMTFDVTNDAYNEVSSVAGSVTVDDGVKTPFEYVFDTPLAHNDRATVTVKDLVCEHSGVDINVSVTVDRLNGEADNGSLTKTISTTTNCSEGGFSRTVVMEEGTGIWCPNCVYGIAGMEYMNETYDDGSYIGIAVHVNDALQIADYEPFITANYESVPNALCNRSSQFFPGKSAMISEYEAMHNLVFARVGLKASFTDESKSCIEITANTEFGADQSDIDYRIGFVLTEDKVGPYMQSNGAAGSGQDAGGFENLKDPTPVMYNDVARKVDGLYGLAESSITAAEAGETVPFEYSMTVSNVTNVSNMSLVALLIDSRSGAIVNAARLRASDIDVNTGVTSVADDRADAPVEYYNLQGMRIERPEAAGVYVRRQGNMTTKVVIR